SVSEPVYQRVVADYSCRLAELDDRAKPMTAQIRAESQKLNALIVQVEAASEEVRLLREELEFRRAVGELNDSDLAERRMDPDRLIAEYENTLAAAGHLRARIAAALGSDDKLPPPLS